MCLKKSFRMEPVPKPGVTTRLGSTSTSRNCLGCLGSVDSQYIGTSHIRFKLDFQPPCIILVFLLHNVR